MINRKKLIEVALPLEAINKASAREKSIRHGHPSTLHLWWARRPLAAARAVIFAQMVDDPSAHPGKFTTEEAQEEERQRLFRLIEELVKWENTTNHTVLAQARDEIWKSWRATCAENKDHPRATELFDPDRLPAFHDPFAGGGSLPLEAQRLGLEAYASDLNPVAVLICKAMIEIPPRFAGLPPVNPNGREKELGTRASRPHRQWHSRGYLPHFDQPGLLQSITFRLYDSLPRDVVERWKQELGWREHMSADDPLVAELRERITRYEDEGHGHCWLARDDIGRLVEEALLHFDDQRYRLLAWCVMPNHVHSLIETREGSPLGDVVHSWKSFTAKEANKLLGRGGDFWMPDYHDRFVRDEDHLAAAIAYIEGNPVKAGLVDRAERWEFSSAAARFRRADKLAGETPALPGMEIAPDRRSMFTPLYGMTHFKHLFTPRQVVALTTFSDLVSEAMEHIQCDAVTAGLPENNKPLREGGTGATAYAESVGVYLGFLVSKLADKGSTLCTWDAGPASNRTASGRSARVATVRVTFSRQALPMTWDYAEVNFFSESVGSIETVLKTLSVPLTYLSPSMYVGKARQTDAQLQTLSHGAVISTDPPYYDNIGYADLSDFFYVWLRRSLRPVFPQLFATLAAPKVEELVATPYRHGSKEKAETFFLDGMTQAMRRLAEQAHPAFPITIYYAFKQSEDTGTRASRAQEKEAGKMPALPGIASTGWETFLDAVIRAGFAVSGTWPIRTELGNRMIGRDTNALASSIVLVCRKCAADAPTATRRKFVAELKAGLPQALAHLQAGNIAPVDLAQAAIGPGMAVYTRYSKVLDAEGKALTVREALALINQTLDEALAEQEGDFDADTRWALTWFEQSGFAEGEFGVAETLSKAKNTSVAGMVDAGVLKSSRGKVRLLKPDELPADWDPSADPRLNAWETVHHLIRVLGSGGEGAAAELVAKLGSQAEVARELAYRLYTLCERKKRPAEALAYNGLVQSWPEIARLAREGGAHTEQQAELFEEQRP